MNFGKYNIPRMKSNLSSVKLLTEFTSITAFAPDP